MLLLLACAAPPAADPPAPDPTDTAAPDDTAPTDTDTAADSGTETGDTGAETGEPTPVGWACPADMAAVPAESPAFCIDRYEVTVADGVATGLAGVIPTVGYSIEEAMAFCAATPALDAAGEAYATRRLVTTEEWVDAGDGVVGEGGTAFPWGERWEDDVCATMRADGTQVYMALQPTGAFPSCVSTAGVYDQIGNAWEWMDSGRVLDVAGALAEIAAAGTTLTEDPAGLRVTEGGSGGFAIESTGVSPPSVRITDEGFLELDASQIPAVADWLNAGYLRSGEARLPVTLLASSTDADAPWRMFAAWDYDGRPLPEKRGCAYYTGWENACSLDASNSPHMPDFTGTIGFRCAVEPYPVYASARP